MEENFFEIMFIIFEMVINFIIGMELRFGIYLNMMRGKMCFRDVGVFVSYLCLCCSVIYNI